MKRPIITIVALTLTLFSLGASAGDAKKGAVLYKKNDCATCHAKDGMGVAKVFSDNKPRVDINEGPRILGLEEKYIVTQMIAIQGKDPNVIRQTEFTREMKKVTKDLTKQDFEDIAAYVSQEMNKPAPRTYQSTFSK